MNAKANHTDTPRTAVRFQVLMLIVFLCPWLVAAQENGWNAGAQLAQQPYALTPVRFIEVNPSPEFATQERPKNEAAEIRALIQGREFDKALALAARMTQASPNDPSGYNLQGMAYLGKQDVLNARRSFETALKVSPDDAIALLNLAQIDIRNKDAAAARKRLQGVLAKDRNNVEAMLGLAELEILKGDSPAALAWFEKAKVARPDAVDPRLNIAAYHMRRENFKQAIQELTDAARVIPGNAHILNLLGQAQLADGQGKSAIETFRKVVAARPDLPQAHYQLAKAQIATNDAAGATQTLTRALQIKPDFLDAAILLAALHTKANRYAEALKLAKHLQSVQPGSPVGLALEGDILMTQQRYGDAAKIFEKLLAQKNADSGIIIKLHAAQTRSGNGKAADANLQGWLKDHPDDLIVLQFAAAENSKKGNKKLAIEQYERALQKEPKNQTTLNNLAVLYQQVGDRRALATAEAAYKLNQQSPVINDTLGWILVEQGDIKRGLGLLRSALELAPKNPEIRYHVAAALAKAGDRINARKQLEALLAAEPAFPQREAAQALLKQL